jgi:hypothetical protein
VPESITLLTTKDVGKLSNWQEKSQSVVLTHRPKVTERNSSLRTAQASAIIPAPCHFTPSNYCSAVAKIKFNIVNILDLAGISFPVAARCERRTEPLIG